MVTTSLKELIKVKSGDGIAVTKLGSFGKFPVYGGNGIAGFTSSYNTEKDTMIIGRVGEKCGNVNISRSRCWVSDNALVVTPVSKYNMDYLSYLLEHINLNDYANRNAQPVISGRIIYAIETPYAEDLREQEEIAKLLHRFDDHIKNLSELIEKKKGIRDGALEDLVSGRTRLAGFNGEWIYTTINAITKDVITGGTPSTSHPEYWGGKIPWLASTEIHQKLINRETTGITELGLMNSSAKIAPAKSVLIALAGQGKTRGTAAYLLRNMALNQSLAALVADDNTSSKFLFFLMESMYIPLRELSSGDGGRGGLNKKLLKGVEIHIPSDLREQEAIAEALTSMDSEIRALEEEREKMIQIREGAMDDLLTGKVRLSV